MAVVERIGTQCYRLVGFFNELGITERGYRGATRKLAKALLPPAVLEMRRAVMCRLDREPWLEYAPHGWNTPLPASADLGWDSPEAVETERRKWTDFTYRMRGTAPLAFSHEHTDLSAINVSFQNINLTYAYVLGLASLGRKHVSVLDYGGSLGHYYQLGKGLFPSLAIDFHCKEVPSTADLGRTVNPEVRWYADDTCLDRKYDLIMLNGVLQYIREWRDVLFRLRHAVGGYLFLGQLPLVERGPGFVALQRHYGTAMLHEQFNRATVSAEVQKTGLQFMREFVTGYRPVIRNAPEQCELRSWLFTAPDND